MINRLTATGLFLLSTLIVNALAQADSGSDITTKHVGMGSIEAGQVMRGEPRGNEMIAEKIWYQRVYMHMGFDAMIEKNIKLFVEAELMVHYSWTQSKDMVDNLRPQYLVYPHHLEGCYAVGNAERPYLTLGFGVFPFKYNPDVRNLGEYLYRTGTYPPTMSNQFDFPMGRLTGFKVSSNWLPSLNLTAMLTSESQVIPLQDWGVSVLGDYTILNSISIGSGVFFSHLFSVNEINTTPKLDNVASIDTTATDTIIRYYTFRGTKLMARLAFDPKPFIPLDIFGKNDLKIYSEAAIIGLENFPVYYMDLWKRTPIMVGFNVPAFKILDVLSVELEWYKWNYPNAYSSYLWQNQSPKPEPTEGTNYNSAENELKWSVYAKKQLANHFSIVGQIAFDHMRLETNAFQQGGTYYGDAMHKHGDWAWILKTQFTF